jgi:hypothetical protein
VGGRVYDPASNDAGVQNATVLLDRSGGTLSKPDGSFTLRAMSRGPHVIRVRALGYQDLEITLSITRDTTLFLALRRAPIELGGVGVVLEKIDFDGVVRDPRTNSWLADAEVTSDQGHQEWTNLFGRFDLDDVFDGPPLRMVVRAFRYLPLDTTFIPNDRKRLTFDLAVDPVVARMIGAYVERLDVRGGKRVLRYRPPLDRDELARLRANTTLREVLEQRFPPFVVRSIGCLFVDEFEYRFGKDDDDYRRSVYEGTYVNDVERIELFEFPGEGRLIMVRVYTADFFRTHVSRAHELATPSMIETPMGFFCR